MGSAEGQRPSHIVGRRGPRPCKAPEGDRSPPSTYTPKRTKSCIPTCNQNTPAPRIESRIFLFVKAKGNNKDRFAHKLKVANRSFSVAEGSPARAGAERSEREKGGDFALGDSKGRSPWRFFGDFLIGEKVTRVQGGAPA